jgi:hypothetical protein
VRRAADVFSPFACRRCLGLEYMSTREPVGHRGYWRAGKIVDSLDETDDEFLLRPAGMGSRTYRRRIAAYDAALARQARQPWPRWLLKRCV